MLARPVEGPGFDPQKWKKRKEEEEKMEEEAKEEEWRKGRKEEKKLQDGLEEKGGTGVIYDIVPVQWFKCGMVAWTRQ